MQQARTNPFCVSSEFKFWNGNCYYFHIDEGVKWKTARDRCLAKSAEGVKVHLVSIHSAEEQTYIVDEMIKTRESWIGFHKFEDGKFKPVLTPLHTY